ncbi:hypothetical protein BLL37_10660 [Pseudomonas azotoformans]|uniref:Glycosyltransferase n=2 Tax=Pseudomonas azotoformans TaxID=47878 RepID=A0A1V2JJH6_PSEAZ|nr:hypothetical protein BFL39_16460 [Pseudomonas azotoformans]ONH45439.1 hypothetical protein BLL37_10660 [Pseudomonas azotoformans]
MGEQAFLIVHPHFPPYLSAHPTLNTPVLTKRVMDFHRAQGLTPITVYPESIKGNPMRAPFIVRYVLNYAGLLGGDALFPEAEYCISYSAAIAATVPNSKQTLFIPASDPNFFKPPAPGAKRQGGCFYAGKYKNYHGGKTFAVTDGLVEIVRDRDDEQTPEQIRDLFQQSERFYCYENSALAIEAMLCGCPVVFLPNEHFTELIGKGEHGTEGYVWGDNDAAGFERAQNTVGLARERYLSLYGLAEDVLADFVAQTQVLAQATAYDVPMSDAYVEKITRFSRYFGVIKMIYLMIRDRGIGYTAGLILARVKTGRTRLSDA